MPKILLLVSIYYYYITLGYNRNYIIFPKPDLFKPSSKKERFESKQINRT